MVFVLTKFEADLTKNMLNPFFIFHIVFLTQIDSAGVTRYFKFLMVVLHQNGLKLALST